MRKITFKVYNKITMINQFNSRNHLRLMIRFLFRLLIATQLNLIPYKLIKKIKLYNRKMKMILSMQSIIQAWSQKICKPFFLKKSFLM
jgi:hypothetical protein